MCDFPSALIHRKTRDIIAARLDSHSATRMACGITDKDRNYIEFEWPDGKSLFVRDADCHGDERAEIEARLLGKWPTRDKMVAALKAMAAKRGYHYIESKADADKVVESKRIVMYGSFDLPNLAKSGYIYAPSAKTFNAPVLAESGNIDAGSATTFNAPVLAKSGYIYAPSAKTFNAPVLAESGNIYAPSAKTFNAPVLAKSGYIYAPSATTFNAPVLAKLGYIDAGSAKTFNAPKVAHKRIK